MTLHEVESEIGKHMPVDEFLRIHERLAYLRKEEEDKLKALAELQQMYLAANTDQQRDTVKDMVGKIRELSRRTREEIRSLNAMLHQRLELSLAKELYERYLAAQPHSPK